MKALPTLFSATALALAGIAAPASAHDVASGPVIGAASTLLTVSAEGRSTRTPNLATFSAGVTTQAKTASEALTANSADMNRVMAALKRAGIADRDIQTSNLSLNPIYQPQRPMPDGTYQPAEPTIIGYQVTNMLNIRQRDIAQSGRVIDTLVAAGINQINGPSFEVDKPDEALDEARVDAMKKARARADLYAKAAGLKVARILTITEGGGYYPQPPVIYAKSARADMASAPTPVSPGEMAMNANVSVAFELTP